MIYSERILNFYSELLFNNVYNELQQYERFFLLENLEHIEEEHLRSWYK